MEKAAAGARAGSLREFGSAWRGIAAAGLCCLCAPGWAQDAAAPATLVAEAREAPRLEVKASALPQIEPQESGFQAPRVDVSLLPGRTGLGVAVGMSGLAARSGIQPLGTHRPSMDVGLHLRQVVHSNQVDITAWRRVPTAEPDAYTLIQQRQPVYGARVEMQLNPVRRTSLRAERGFLGLQLESGARISIKRRNGGPMVYYRNSF